MLISIVVPCYHSEKTLVSLTEQIAETFSAEQDKQWELILVNDYSTDNTWNTICKLARQYPKQVTGINLAKNFGQHAAIMCGLHHAKGDIIIGMDDDLQNHPSQIPAFLEKIDEGYDVVFGVFRSRKFSVKKNLTGFISRTLLWKLVDRPKDIQMSSFWAARRFVIDKVLEYDQNQAFIQLLFFRTTSNIANIEIEHYARTMGQSNYTFRRGLRLFLSFINYSIKPLHFATYLGVFVSAVGFIAALYVLIHKLIHPDVAVGWSSLMCAMLILFGFLFLILGVIGEYIGRLVLGMNETPQYVVREIVGPEAASHD